MLIALACEAAAYVSDKGYFCSPELLAAQQLLEQRRQSLLQKRPSSTASAPFNGRSHTNLSAIFQQLPAHLGWGSQALTISCRSKHPSQEPFVQLTSEPPKAAEETETAVSSAVNSTIKLYPDIALALLKHECTAAGRIWLLLRHLDASGQGWLTVDEIRAKLTSKNAVLRICGWRQMRNLLRAGEGIFWQRQNGRIWLRSVTKVAQALTVIKLKQRPVALPVAVLTQSIGQVRAHFYASFHSSRQAKPISREAIEAVSHVPARTQRRYEKRAHVRRRSNFAVGPQATKTAVERTHWRHGHAAFSFKDFQGQHGRIGQTYIAWQLPNSYEGPHALAAKGQQKRINHTLTDLFMQGITGNGQRRRLTQRFFGNGRLAAKTFSRHPETIYWQNASLGNGRYRWWHVMEQTE